MIDRVFIILQVMYEIVTEKETKTTFDFDLNWFLTLVGSLLMIAKE